MNEQEYRVAGALAGQHVPAARLRPEVQLAEKD
jgi:hypothetical protein